MRRQKCKPGRVHLHAYERLQAICVEIQKGKFPNRADLAKLHTVERTSRTIQRDLNALRRLDAPLEYNPSKKGFYFSDPTWQMPPLALTQGELISFFAAERILKRLGASTAEASLARDAVRSLAALLPSEVVVDLNALEAAISFAPEPILDASPDTLHKLTSAATGRQTLFIHYYSQHRAEHTEREVDVLLLHNHLGEWYAVCYDHLSRELRDFHAGRIKQIVNTRRQFTPPADWDSKKYLESGFGMFRGGREVEVEVEFDAYQARYARERTFHPTQRNKPLRGGGLRISFKATEGALGQVARWLLQYGEHATAVSPKELRAMMRERLNRAAQLYD